MKLSEVQLWHPLSLKKRAVNKALSLAKKRDRLVEQVRTLNEKIGRLDDAIVRIQNNLGNKGSLKDIKPHFSRHINFSGMED